MSENGFFLRLTIITKLFIYTDFSSGLELIASKWAHSLVEFDLAWGNAQKPLDNALRALADKGSESRLKYVRS